jgi:cystathionine beta-synthase
MPDNIRNYLSKHLNSDWMYERGYMSEQECADSYVSSLVPNSDWGQDRTVAELPLHEAYFIKISTTIGVAIELMRDKGFD